MATTPNDLWLVRHGETEWSLTRRHTGRTDIPLTPHGERQAATVAPALSHVGFALVLSSPLQRARRTAELAGFGDRLELDDDLVEVDYGDYEGLTTVEIRERRPGWDLWRDGCPDGETIAEVAARCTRALARARAADGPVLVVAHSHLLRTFASVALELDPNAGRHLVLDPTSISVIGAEREVPALRLWNDVGHLPTPA
ncbi:histidine phosphatase family protein [Conexibacter sp. CPCC 206217]|uniref:histidine phosphatase family protein n=1 Tax=Conexibacter sp. CPCC 206217 TaxID=3064574 RepID=UPI00271BBF2C|nr:histidine phosphatase family protein [Conexibacter sp. CPCC 206217]MDO8212995.1 histidine phosphatase family protein [Conexibacter sp. CPCC 206217]